MAKFISFFFVCVCAQKIRSVFPHQIVVFFINCFFFSQLGIIYTKKKFIVSVLFQKSNILKMSTWLEFDKSSHGSLLDDGLTLAYVGPSIGSGTIPLELILQLPNAPRLAFTFTTRDNVAQFQSCTCIYNRMPILAILDGPKEKVFVLDLQRDVSSDGIVLDTGQLLQFMAAAVAGSWPSAKIGLAPPPKDSPPLVGALNLRVALSAVQCTFRRLVYDAPHDVVLCCWSDRCPCCPVALRALDGVVSSIMGKLSCRTLCNGCSTNRQECTLEQQQAMDRGESMIGLVVCNVDENDLEDADWPPDVNLQVVPLIRFYPYKSKQQSVVMEGERTPDAILKFIGMYSTCPAVRGLCDRGVSNQQNCDVEECGDIVPPCCKSPGGCCSASAECKSLRKRTRSKTDCCTLDLLDLF